MAVHKHQQQRPWHEFRYGVRHFLKHRGGKKHGHRRRQLSAVQKENKRRSILIWLCVGIFLMLVVGGVLVVSAWHSLTEARSSLNNARSVITQLENNRHELLSAEGRTAAEQSLTQVSADAVKAEQTLRSSTSLKVLGWLPIIDTQRKGVLDLVSDIQTTANTGNGLIGQVNTLVADSQGASVSIPQLEVLQSDVAIAKAKLKRLNRPSSGLIGSLGDARVKFDDADTTLTNQLARGQQILGYALPFLGASGPRTYLLATENNSEMRDQGSILSVGTLQTQSGKITVVDPQSVGGLQLSSPVNYVVPSGMQQIFGGYQPTLLWQSANATAGFPWSGGDLQAMYAQTTGQHVNGVLALDVPTLASLLGLTGAVSVPGISEPVTATNVSDILLHQLYNGFPANSQQGERHDEVSSVARAVVDKLSNEKVDLAALANVLSQDVAGRHLLLWDEVPQYQATLVKFGASGAIDGRDKSRTFHAAVENSTATKMDYYVTVSVSQQIHLKADNEAEVDTSITTVNHAPAGAQPSLQLGPDNIHSSQVGQYVGTAYLWGPVGTGIVQSGSTMESGLNVTPAYVSVLPQQQTTVTFKTVIPNAVRNGKLTLSYVPQPRLAPETVSATVQATGWHLRSSQTVHATLTRTTGLTWDLVRG
jgi:hypothetical protein